MKKLLSTLTAVAILASCSDSDGTYIEDNKTYKVAFNVTEFVIENESLGKTAIELPLRGGYFEYVIYKEDGSVLKANVIPQSSTPTETFTIDEELPAGKYDVAIMYALAETNNRGVIYSPSNYNTDYCIGNLFIVKGTTNEDIYFKTFPLTVTANDNTIPVNVDLEPMWSEIDIKITDGDTFVLPEEANLVGCFLSPDLSGFSIKSQKPTKEKVYVGGYTPDRLCTTKAAIREEGGVFGTIASENDDVTIKLIFAEHSEYENFKKWGEKIIYKGKIEKGYRYTFTGAIGNQSSSNGSAGLSFNVNLKSLKNKEEIPFE